LTSYSVDDHAVSGREVIRMSSPGSTVVRRQLGRELRALREAARKTREDVAAAAIASVAKLARIESGQTPVKLADVRELCRLYEAGRQTSETLAAMALATNKEAWWEEYGAGRLPRWFGMYLSLEAVASSVRSFEPLLVHGLFQTADYAREVERAVSPEAPGDTVESYVTVRMARQERVFGRADRPRIRVVLGEQALNPAIGTPGLMGAQLEHLRRRGALPGVEVRILPHAAGLHPGVFGAFSLLEFDDPNDPPVAYLETYDAARYPEAQPQVARFRRRLDLIDDLSVPLEEFLDDRTELARP
jgi:transcriptional regulator with XRE-family HTH domain